jgi:hypothetical protein
MTELRRLLDEQRRRPFTTNDLQLLFGAPASGSFSFPSEVGL